MDLPQPKKTLNRFIREEHGYVDKSKLLKTAAILGSAALAASAVSAHWYVWRYVHSNAIYGQIADGAASATHSHAVTPLYAC